MAWKETGNLSFADAFIQSHSVLEEFDEIDTMVDWQPVQKILSVISNSKVGEKAYPPLLMFKAILLQKWHNLSDPGLEKQLVRDIVFKRFTGLSLSDPVPDHSTIHRFRQKLIDQQLEDPIFKEINRQLQSSGIMIKEGAISIIDASVIEAKNCRPKKNSSGQNTQDPEAKYNTKLGADGKRRTTYGYKNHMNVDEDGFIQKTICTPANEHDSIQFKNLLTGSESAATADSAYYSKKHLELLNYLGVKEMLLRRAFRNKPLTEVEKQHNFYASQVRNVVERVFGTLKNHYGLAKARYMGQKRNQLNFTLMSIAYNLKRGLKIQQQTCV